MQPLAGLRLALRERRGTPVFAAVAVALVVGVSTAVYAAVHSLFSLPPIVPPPQDRALPEPLRTHVAGERLDAVTSIRGLPLGVRDGLQKLFGGQDLDIADPGSEFNVTGDAGHSALPLRRLIAAGCSTDHCLVYYERGGSPHSWQVALFHWTPAGTRFEWGASAPAGMANIAAVRKAVLSGAINRPNSVW